ncbi:MAG TPA: isoprenylcysteine carboxylmethyltransferase family protein [Candidatus Kapabacteria bacterium]
MSSTTFFLSLLALIVVERLVELRIAKRNTALLKARGALEFGGKHYGLIVLLHTTFFIGIVLEFFLGNRSLPYYFTIPLLAFAVAQILRASVLYSLSTRWTTRIIVLPGEELISSGPYRFLRHPNYLAVALELLSLPLIFGLWDTAILFSLLNAFVLLRIRIPAEEKALKWSRSAVAVGNNPPPLLVEP